MTQERKDSRQKQEEETEAELEVHFDESNDQVEEHIVEEDRDLSEADVLKEQIDKIQKESQENYEQFLRARADLENFRRRSRKDMDDLMKYASLPLVESLLPVLDNFERALGTFDQSSEFQSFYEGVEMVYRQLQSALTEAGLIRIEAKGEPFDPHQHNAVMQEESSEVESNRVLEELQSGYRFKERIVRPSMVKISQ